MKLSEEVIMVRFVRKTSPVTLSLLLLLPIVCYAGDPATVRSNWWRAIGSSQTVLRLTTSPAVDVGQWQLPDGLTNAYDSVLGCQVLQHKLWPQKSVVLSPLAVDAPCEITALVRATTKSVNGHGAELLLGVTNVAGQVQARYAFYFDTAPTDNSTRVRAQTRWLEDTKHGSGPLQYLNLAAFQRPLVDPANYPNLDAGFASDRCDEHWTRLTVRHLGHALLYYVDGVLVWHSSNPGITNGVVGLRLGGDVRVAELAVRQLPPAVAVQFHPLPLERLCNAGFSAARPGAPPAGEQVVIHGIPFVFPQRTVRGDHLDVAPSLVSFRNQPGSFTGPALWPDPIAAVAGRLILTAPAGAPRRLWLIATADDRPHHVPTLTVRFYKPGAGVPIDAVVNVPSARASAAPLEGAVRLSDGLWLIPVVLDPGALGARYPQTLALELTKAVHGYRAYPDPTDYAYLQGGLPSSVRILAMTLEHAPLRVVASGNRDGNVYIQPENPVWEVQLHNLTTEPRSAQIELLIKDPAGQPTRQQHPTSVPAATNMVVRLPIAPSQLGLHQVRTIVTVDGQRIEQQGAFVQLPPNTRQDTVETSRWGLWCWAGMHDTNPDIDANLYLLRAAGTVVAPEVVCRERPGIGMTTPPYHWLVPHPAPWAFQDPYDPAEYAAFKKSIGEKAAQIVAENPAIQYVSLFNEQAISLPITYGLPGEYTGQPIPVTGEDAKRIRAFVLTAKAAAEGIREHCPRAKILLGWCETIFTIPLFKHGFPRELVYGIGVDLPQFERMPEMPPRSVAPNRMWMLQDQLKKLGYDDLEIVHTESYYPPSHPLGVGHRGGADYTVRTAVLSLAQGSTRLLNCFSLHDSGDYWGSQHYGCPGLISAAPEWNPKPAFPAYATMTRLLDRVEYDGYVPTGSHSAFCLRFKKQDATGFVHCLWTLRGERAATLSFASSAKPPRRVDENSNEHPLSTDGATVTLTPTPFWIVSTAPMQSITLGNPVHAERPHPFSQVLDPLDQPWKYDAGAYGRYESNHWDMVRTPGPMRSEIATTPARKSPVWQITFAPPTLDRPLAAWYGVFRPAAPVTIPGKARAVGLWVNGHSTWGRVIFEIEDANGEIWQSIGTKDDWNCDDIHSWSAFNFDGWRFVEFPLPNHLPGDNYREQDTVWWNHDGDPSTSSGQAGVVDLPVKLTRLIVEQRTHTVYADALLPNENLMVQFDDLTAVYDNESAMSNQAVTLQRQAARVLDPYLAALEPAQTNPIATLQQTGQGAPPSIADLAAPEPRDGQSLIVTVTPVPQAVTYRVYVSHHESGHGATIQAQGTQPILRLHQLQSDTPLWLFVTTVDKDGNESKPSPGRSVVLKDEFPMK